MNTKTTRVRTHIYMPLLISFFLFLAATSAQAVPSFARQTGMACGSCHTIFPELNSFGRTFKLNGYTMTNIKQIEAPDNGLKLDQIPPFSVMLQVSATHKKTDTPRTNTELPDQLSLFYAGEISPHMGSFIQITLEGNDGTFQMDNTDIRYANQAGDITYGATLNNNPTVQDVWNSTLAWGYPFTHGAEVTTPVINSLGGNVAGLGAYANWGHGIYTELTVYNDTGSFDASESIASSSIGEARVSGVAPYWRLAWENNFSSGDSLMIGTYGMQTRLYDSPTDPVTGDPGPASAQNDKYTDIAVDAQYEHTMGNGTDTISAHATYTNEDQVLDLSSPGDKPTLKSTRVDAIYHWAHDASATLAYNVNTGFNGAYDDNAWTAQLSYLPWQNTKFTLQYVGYTQLAGVSKNASDNNTALLQGWLVW